MNIRDWLLGSTVKPVRAAMPAPPTTAANDTLAGKTPPELSFEELARACERVVVPVRIEMSEEAYLRIVAKIPVGVRTKYAEASDFLGLELRKVAGQDFAEVVYSDGSRRPLDREDGIG